MLTADACTTGEGSWRLSQAINASRSFHVIEGLEPGTLYTIRLMVKSLLDNASIFEDVIQTRLKGEKLDSSEPFCTKALNCY